MAALVPLAEKVGLGAPAGLASVDHVYVKLPPLELMTDKSAVVPVTGLGETTMAAASTSVTFALPLTEPLVAVTVALPAVAGAVYRPPELTLPPPLVTAHEKL